MELKIVRQSPTNQVVAKIFSKYFELSGNLETGNSQRFGTRGLQQVETSKNPSLFRLA